MAVVMMIVNYCEKMGLPCECCDQDGNCLADVCTEGQIMDEEEEMMRCVDCTWISPWDGTCVNPDSPFFAEDKTCGGGCPCFCNDWSDEEWEEETND